MENRSFDHLLGWLPNGSSRGFGCAFVSAALKAGDSVVATARRPDQLAGFVEHRGIVFFPSPSTLRMWLRSMPHSRRQ